MEPAGPSGTALEGSGRELGSPRGAGPTSEPTEFVRPRFTDGTFDAPFPPGRGGGAPASRGGGGGGTPKGRLGVWGRSPQRRPRLVPAAYRARRAGALDRRRAPRPPEREPALPRAARPAPPPPCASPA